MSAAEVMSRRQRESLRRRFRPDRVRVLFIGESPPASGRFFYRGDSALYRAMREAFETIDASIAGKDFLAEFRNSGCYLIDLCPDPVDRLDRKMRRATCVAGEAPLARTIASHNPSAIATVVRSIEDIVSGAAAHAGWSGPLLNLPYPGRWSRHRSVFVNKLVRWKVL